jgi:hypothetical protein
VQLAVNEKLILAGKLRVDKAEITLHYGVNGKPSIEKKVTINKIKSSGKSSIDSISVKILI